MKKIAVFFSDPHPLGYPLNKDEYYRSYLELNAEIQACGAEMYIVRGQESYQNNGSFYSSWKFDHEELVESGKISVDAIYDKGSFIPNETSVPVLNPQKINDICTDKWSTYQYFSEFFPTTYKVESAEELSAALNNISTQNAVVKPIDGEEGKGVIIGAIHDVVAQISDVQYPALVQEFIDSSCGIRGIVKGIHDFRIVLIDGEFIFAFVRTPPQGSLKANVALGGQLTVIDQSQIPAAFFEIVSAIDKKMSECSDRVYGVDMAMTPAGPKIIELNSRVGLQENNRHAVFQQFKKKLAAKLLQMATVS